MNAREKAAREHAANQHDALARNYTEAAQHASDPATRNHLYSAAGAHSRRADELRAELSVPPTIGCILTERDAAHYVKR